MAFQPAPQCVEVVLKMSQDGIPAVNVWHVDTGAAVTPSSLLSVWNAFDGWITTNLKNAMSSTVTYDQLIVTDISVSGGGQHSDAPTTTAGVGSGTALPASTALVASLRTARIGRNYRGRTYVTGLRTSDVTNPHFASTTYADGVNDVFANLITTLTGVGYKLVVLSRFLNNVQRAVAVATEVIQVITNTRLDVVRRRSAN